MRMVFFRRKRSSNGGEDWDGREGVCVCKKEKCDFAFDDGD
jgi:hypothetical protein